MPITPDDISLIVQTLEEVEWVSEVRDLLPALRKRVSGKGSPSGFSLESPSQYRREQMSKHNAGRHRHRKHGHRDRHHKNKTPPSDVIILTPEKYAAKLGETVKRLANENCRLGIHVPYEKLRRIADDELRTGVRKYGYGTPGEVTVPVGTAGNNFASGRRGSVSAKSLSANQGRDADGRLPATVSADGSVQLVALRGDILSLRRWLEQERI